MADVELDYEKSEDFEVDEDGDREFILGSCIYS